jgi:hypothetical protein
MTQPMNSGQLGASLLADARKRRKKVDKQNKRNDRAAFAINLFGNIGNAVLKSNAEKFVNNSENLQTRMKARNMASQAAMDKEELINYNKDNNYFFQKESDRVMQDLRAADPDGFNEEFMKNAMGPVIQKASDSYRDTLKERMSIAKSSNLDTPEGVAELDARLRSVKATSVKDLLVGLVTGDNDEQDLDSIQARYNPRFEEYDALVTQGIPRVNVQEILKVFPDGLPDDITSEIKTVYAEDQYGKTQQVSRVVYSANGKIINPKDVTAKITTQLNAEDKRDNLAKLKESEYLDYTTVVLPNMMGNEDYVNLRGMQTFVKDKDKIKNWEMNQVGKMKKQAATLAGRYSGLSPDMGIVKEFAAQMVLSDLKVTNMGPKGFFGGAGELGVAVGHPSLIGDGGGRQPFLEIKALNAMKENLFFTNNSDLYDEMESDSINLLMQGDNINKYVSHLTLKDKIAMVDEIVSGNPVWNVPVNNENGFPLTEADGGGMSPKGSTRAHYARYVLTGKLPKDLTKDNKKNMQGQLQVTYETKIPLTQEEIDEAQKKANKRQSNRYQRGS